MTRIVPAEAPERRSEPLELTDPVRLFAMPRGRPEAFQRVIEQLELVWSHLASVDPQWLTCGDAITLNGALLAVDIEVNNLIRRARVINHGTRVVNRDAQDVRYWMTEEGREALDKASANA